MTWPTSLPSKSRAGLSWSEGETTFPLPLPTRCLSPAEPAPHTKKATRDGVVSSKLVHCGPDPRWEGVWRRGLGKR